MFFSKVAPETWSLITPFIHEILDELYDHALEHDSTAKLYAGQNIEGLKAVQKPIGNSRSKMALTHPMMSARMALGIHTQKLG